MNWHEYVAQSGRVPEWPYEVNYGKENELSCDVLIIGGGVCGLRAAIAAKQQGADVLVLDRGTSKRSGQGGAGVDHWSSALTNPCSKITPKVFAETCMKTAEGYSNGMCRYINGMENWDTLLETESWGLQIRDVEDEFKGSIYRDEETKLMFAYDIENKHNLRIYGNNIKPIIDKEARRIGVRIVERVCVTGLLTEGGKRGTRAVGAVGVHARTGEFYIVKAKSVIITTGQSESRLFSFAPELINNSTMQDANQVGMGYIIGWRAGAEFTMMERSGMNILAGMGYAPYSTGNNDNTFWGAKIVDKNGKEVKYVDRNGVEIDNMEDLHRSCEPGSFILGHGIGLMNGTIKEHMIPFNCDPNLMEKIKAGEYEPPFYVDWPSMDKDTRDVIWKLMLTNEGKCRIPIFKNWQDWGFDPEKDMLQVPVMDYSRGIACAWNGSDKTPPSWRSGGGGFHVDWTLMTTVPGLFAAGGLIASSGAHGEAQTFGRYAGRHAAKYAADNGEVTLDRVQIELEKNRVYAPVEAEGDIGWKEFNYAVSRIMQDYCGATKTEDTLCMGIERLKDLLETEGQRMYVENPHELARAIEAVSLVDLGTALMEGARARKSSCPRLGFKRLDYPESLPEWNCLVGIKQTESGVESRKIPFDFFLQAPYAPDYEENYRRYSNV